MINSSAAFAGEIAKSSRSFSVKLYNDNLDVSGSIKKVIVNLGSCGDQAFIAGAVFTSYIEVTLDEMVTRLQGLELRLDVGVLAGSTYDYITLGYFTCGAPETSEYQTTFTAQGRIGAKFEGTFTPPAEQSLANIAAALTTQTGVTVAFASGIDTSGVITKEITGATCREALEIVAGSIGGFATETAAGTVLISKYSHTATKIVDGDVMRDLPVSNDYDFTINGVKVTVSPETVEDDGTTTPEVSYSSGDPNVAISNEYMTQALFTQMAGNLTGLSYRPATVVMALGDPRIEPTDVLSVERSNGAVIIVPCMAITHTYDGGWQTQISAPGPEESGFILGATGKAVQQLMLDMLQVKRLFAKYARIDFLNVDRIESRDGATYWDLITNELCLGGYLIRAVPEYAISTSATVAPVTGWSETAPAREDGKFMWQRIALYQGDGTITYSVPTCVQGSDGKGISSTAVDYASSASGTTAPESGWSSTIPTVAAGNFLWSRTTITYTDGTVTRSYISAKQGEDGADGEDATLLKIDSSKGVLFKSNVFETVLTVVIYKGSLTITTAAAMRAEFGSGAYLQWYWRKNDAADWSAMSVSDSHITQDGFMLTITPADVDEKIVFKCELIV